LHVDDADQPLAREHRDGKLRAYGVNGVQVARILLHIPGHHRLARGRGGSGEALAQMDDQALHDFFAVADGVADPQLLELLAIKKNGEQLVGDDLADDFGDVGQ